MNYVTIARHRDTHDPGMQLSVFLAAAVGIWWQPAVAACTPGSSLNKCRQVESVSIAAGLGDCKQRRTFYDCMRLEGCYDLPRECQAMDGRRISCSDLCEQEPGLATCLDDTVRDSPEEDFHLCPHIPKSEYKPPPPSAAEFLAAPAVPLVLTAWAALNRSETSIDPAAILPSLWPSAVRVAVSTVFSIEPLAVVVELPVEFREYLIGLPGETSLPATAEYTFFMNYRIHELEANVEEKRVFYEGRLVGDDAPNRTALASLLKQALVTELPSDSGLGVQQLVVAVVGGRVINFPVFTTTTTTTPPISYTDERLAPRRWRAYRVRCMQGIVYRWEVHELTFFEGGCPSTGRSRALALGSLGGVPISSGEFGSCCSAEKALNGRSGTVTGYWVSSCQSCLAGEAWIGFDLGQSADGVMAVCMQVKQAPAASNQCSKLVVESSDDLMTWTLRASLPEGFATEQEICLPRLPSDHPLIECGGLDDGCGGSTNFGLCRGEEEVCTEYNCRCPRRRQVTHPSFVGFECGFHDDGCGGNLSFGNCEGEGERCESHICKDSNFVATQWRLTCLSGTLGRWWIKEVEFHEDGLCTNPSKQFEGIISSGTADAKHPAANAFDEQENSMWLSRCMPCNPGEAWIGLNFGKNVQIECVGLIQDEGSLQQCAQLALEQSDTGDSWTQRYRYGFGGQAVKAVATLAADFDTASDETLSITKRLATHWRLTCNAKSQRAWGVFELEFYDDESCKGSLDLGIESLISSKRSAWPIENAFDRQAHTLWQSSCSECSSGQAYLGAIFKKRMLVKCVRIEQLAPGDGACPEIYVQFSNTGAAGSWTIRDIFHDISEAEYLVLYQGSKSLFGRAATSIVGTTSVAFAAIAFVFRQLTDYRLHA